MTRMKMESVKLQTTSTVRQLEEYIRHAANSVNGNMQRISRKERLSDFSTRAAVEVTLYGKVGLLGGLKHLRLGSASDTWGVQIFVYDLGQERRIELIALGEGVGSRLFGAKNFNASKEKMNDIADILV